MAINIYLGEDKKGNHIFLVSDSNQFQLKKREGEDKEGKPLFSVISNYATLESALVSVPERITMLSSAVTLQDVIDTLNVAKQMIQNALEA